ncbi:MAG: NADH-quinone oxidoreductase subunit J [Saprospiraceae bacterium]|jgi:NADH-quinone oxidoreductase subunit J|nr:NADH-quinone oxidoreductase subunit J [Saprospiraceae bacterium]MBP9193056.1 NADH-quinone oxidoreductase subunit J [Saprospiraceae bacterium]
MVTELMFYFLSFVAILSAIMMISTKNPVHSILYLIVTFFAIAGHYFLLNAQFLGMVHIIVYAGAIMVLFLYVIMMLNLNEDAEPVKSKYQKISATLSGGIFMLVMVAGLRSADVSLEKAKNTDIGLVNQLGKVLFHDYLLPFELSSILLLSAMIGAVFLSKK